MEQKPVPTLYEWMGEMEAIDRLFTLSYTRVPANPDSASSGSLPEGIAAEALGG